MTDTHKSMPELRRLLAGALRVARHFDNDDAAVDGLTASLVPLEDTLTQLSNNLTEEDLAPAIDHPFREAAELVLTRHARGGAHGGISIGNLLDMAASSFGRRLSRKKIKLKITPTDFVFLPTDGKASVDVGGGAGIDAPRFEDRFNNILMLIQKQGITIDDCDFIGGKVPNDAMRLRSYMLISIPRMNCEVAVCDQVGQATYVVHGNPGPLFWATYNKDQLKQRDDVTRVTMAQGWETRLWDAMTGGNAVGPKVKVAATQGMKLTEDMMLHHALLWAADHNGVLPTDRSGEVPGLPGQKWQNWHEALRKCYNGLTRADCKGLAHLFQIYGLKTGMKENPKKIAEAIANIKADMPHGLTVGEIVQMSEDMILHHALLWATENNGKLPTSIDGDIPGLPGLAWANFDASLRGCSNGLTRPECKGLHHLFQIYGLKMGRKENPKKIAEAIANIKADRPHGLVAGDIIQITEGMILHHALLWAAENNGKLPTRADGDIPGLPGQTWGNWDSSLGRGSNGLTRVNCQGLINFFQIYGLKIGRQENSEKVAVAIANIKAGKPHGLVASEPIRLTEDLILEHALRWAVENKGKLPVQDDGEVSGLPGQTWKNWTSNIRACANGLTRVNCVGLTHLFQIYGLKTGRKENTTVVQQAIENVLVGKPHGLIAGDPMTLSEDLILQHALLWAADHNGLLPTDRKGGVPGSPGQTWSGWQDAIRHCGNGLTRADCKGLNHLFQIYGLKTGRKENADLMQQAIENVLAGRPHGLVAANDPVATRPVTGSTPPEALVA